MATLLKNASTFYLGCDFPHYGYSYSLFSDTNEAVYIKTLNEKLSNPDFNLLCLASGNTEAILNQLEEKYANKEIIKQELERVNKNLKEKTQTFKNIDIRKSDSPGDFALIEEENGEGSLFMLLKDSNREIKGGVLINSKEITKQIKQHFLSQMSNSPQLDIEKNIIFDTIRLNKEVSRDKIIAFDVNRVFTQNHTTIEIAKKAGKQKEVSNFIKKQIEGSINAQEAIERSAELLKGLEVSKLSDLYKKIPLMKNVKEGIKKLKDKGYYIVAISTGFSQVINPLCEFLGIDKVYCNVLEEKKGKLTGNIIEKNVMIDNVKYYIVKYLLEKHSISEENSISVGDGFSDLDMLKATKHRIAFNPSSSLKRMFKEKNPLITDLIEEKDFMVLTKKILKTHKSK